VTAKDSGSCRAGIFLDSNNAEYHWTIIIADISKRHYDIKSIITSNKIKVLIVVRDQKAMITTYMII
jgi:hypothetical protein